MPSPTIGKIAQEIERWAPPFWAESWDNVGLLVGSPDREAGKILVALELTDGVVEEAIACGASLIFVHHPPIFRPLKALRFDGTAGRRLERLITAGIGCYAAHTNLDQAQGGTNDTLAELAGLTSYEVIQKVGEEKYFKLVVFVPKGHEEAVRSAIATAGAGHIGNYSTCTFQTAGTGTFLPLEGTNPYLGRQGKLEYAEEFRLETILPESIAPQVVRAMISAHPYEEVAYDLYPLANPGRVRGHGRIGELAEATTLGALAGKFKAALGLGGLRVVGDLARSIRKVAVGAGAGVPLIELAARRGADVLITGDIGYHNAQDSVDAGLALIDIGHFNSEVIVVPKVAQYLRTKLAEQGLTAEIVEAQAGRDPFVFF